MLRSAGSVVAAAVAGYALVLVPLAALFGPGRGSANGDRQRLYARYRSHLLALASAVLAAAAVAGFSRAALGARLPSGSPGPALGWAVAAIAAAAAASRRAPERLLPRTAGERGQYSRLAVLGAAVEELTYRCFGPVVLLQVAGCSRAVAVLVSALAFGLAHAPQGVRVVCCAAVAAVAFSGLLYATGSLLVPVLVHAAANLSAARWSAPAAGHARPRGQKWSEESWLSSRSPS